MIEQQGLFKRHFVGRDGFYWWIGQIAPASVWKSNIPGLPVANNTDTPGFGERYKVRIMGHHTALPEDLPDEQLPWATVMYPVTAGGGPGASAQSANLTQGTFVFGFFMDGEDAQQPVIMGAVGYNDYNYVTSQLKANQPRFVPFSGFEKGKVSVYSVKENPGGDTPPVTGSSGPNRAETTIESANASNSTIDQASQEEKQDGKIKEPLASPPRCKTTGGQLQLTLRNAIQDIERTKKSVYKWQYGLAEKAAKKEAEIQKKIAKYTKAVMKWFKDILTNVERDVNAFLNRKSKQFDSLLFPNEREKLKKSKETALDLIACLFKKLISNLGRFIFDFLSGAVDRIINVANCLVNNFIGGILGQLASIIDSIIKQAFGTFNALIGGAASIAGEALGIAGAALEIILRALSLITCDEEPSCPVVNSWSIWDGATQLFESPADVEDLIGRITGFAGKVTDTIEGVIDLENIKNLLNIDIDSLFDLSNCFTGPRSCGPPTLQIFGAGSGAAVNLIISQGGSVIGADVVNAGIGYAADAIFGKVYDDCGKGSGAVIDVVIGPVIVIDSTVTDPGTVNGLPTTTDPTGTLPPGTVTTGVTGIRVVEGGTGYLPSPDGSVGGDERTWAENNETIVQHENGDYEVPIPPGNQVCVVEGDIVTLPVGSSVTTETNGGSGGNEFIVGGRAHIMQRAGCFTSPEVNYEKLAATYPADATGAYPVILYLCEIVIDNSGINYQPTDRVIIEPNNGAEATFTLGSLGEVTGIKIINGGEGFTDLPEVYIESETGINAVLSPRLCIDRIGENVDKPITGDLVSVVDCVGKF